MTLQDRIAVLVELGRFLQKDSPERQEALIRAEQHNRWFTQANSLKALNNIATVFLQAEALNDWVANYPNISTGPTNKKVGLVLAGNIPAVGFHDILATFLAGHQALIKYSEKDAILIPFLLNYLISLDERCATFFEPITMLRGFDAVIATGSNNSALYFEQYFSKYPSIIRKNRNGVAVLDGTESVADLQALGKDIFTYFGLGCRSIAKLYVPEGYDFPVLMAALDEFKDIMDHHKYRNNYDYNRSIYLLNTVPHFANDCVMVLEQKSPLSRIAALHYETYSSKEGLVQELKDQATAIQCIATAIKDLELPTVDLGAAQQPILTDYADGVDTLEFLTNLN